MIRGVLIVNGSCEHPCWQNDDFTCSLSCPNLCNKDGFAYGEAVALGLSIAKGRFSCAVLGKGRWPQSFKGI